MQRLGKVKVRSSFSQLVYEGTRRVDPEIPSTPSPSPPPPRVNKKKEKEYKKNPFKKKRKKVTPPPTVPAPPPPPPPTERHKNIKKSFCTNDCYANNYLK